MANHEIEMFGTSEKSIDAKLMTAYNINMRLMGMLSDAQEMLINGDQKGANQMINQVKYYFCEYTDTRSPIYAQRLTEEA